jgi:hypothetical protein
LSPFAKLRSSVVDSVAGDETQGDTSTCVKEDGDTCSKVVKWQEPSIDECGKVTLEDKKEEWSDKEAPKIDTCPGPVEKDCPETGIEVIIPTATDNCQETVDVKKSVDKVDLTNQCEGQTVIVNFEADDGCGNKDTSCTQTFTLKPDSEAPVITCPKLPTFQCPGTYQVTDKATATDNCGQVEVTGGLSSVEFTKQCETEEIPVTFTANDGCSEATCTEKYVKPGDTTPPTIQCEVEAPDTFCTGVTELPNCGFKDPYPLPDLTANDNCVSGTATNPGPIPPEESILCEDKKIDLSYKYNDGCNDADDYKVSFLIKKDTLEYSYTGDKPVVQCDAPLYPTIKVTETRCGKTVEIDGLPANKASPLPTCDDVTVTYTYDALCDPLSREIDVLLTVEDDAPPEVTCATDRTFECNTTVTAKATANDNCDPDLTLMLKEGTTGQACSGTIALEASATDSCGNTGLCTESISWKDNTPPNFDSCPDKVTVACPGDFTPVIPGATDICQPSSTVTANIPLVKLSNVCDGEVITVIFTADDNCGNTNSGCTQVFELTADTTSPEFDSCPGTFQTETCQSTFDASSLSAKDEPCNDDVDIEGPASVTATCNQTMTALYLPVDQCDNEGTACEVTVSATTPAPVCESSNAIAIATCDANWQTTLPDPVVQEFCGYSGSIELETDLSMLDLNCANPSATLDFLYTRDSDDCSDETPCSYDVSISCQDDTAYGYLPTNEDAGGWKTYNNTAVFDKVSWAWGTYFYAAQNEEFEFKMYAGAAKEEIPPGVYVGSVYVNPVAGTFRTEICSSSTFIKGFHVEISKPTTHTKNNPYQVESDPDLFCKSLRPPGQFEIQNDNTLECVEGESCCVAVHWSVEYEAACSGANCGDLVEYLLP